MLAAQCLARRPGGRPAALDRLVVIDHRAPELVPPRLPPQVHVQAIQQRVLERLHKRRRAREPTARRLRRRLGRGPFGRNLRHPFTHGRWPLVQEYGTSVYT